MMTSRAEACGWSFHSKRIAGAVEASKFHGITSSTRQFTPLETQRGSPGKTGVPGREAGTRAYGQFVSGKQSCGGSGGVKMPTSATRRGFARKGIAWLLRWRSGHAAINAQIK